MKNIPNFFSYGPRLQTAALRAVATRRPPQLLMLWISNILLVIFTYLDATSLLNPTLARKDIPGGPETPDGNFWSVPLGVHTCLECTKYFLLLKSSEKEDDLPHLYHLLTQETLVCAPCWSGARFKFSKNSDYVHFLNSGAWWRQRIALHKFLQQTTLQKTAHSFFASRRHSKFVLVIPPPFGLVLGSEDSDSV